MRPYEMMVIVDAAVEEPSVEFQAVEALVNRLGGEVSKTDVWGKRRFAYPIDKKTDGYYAVMDIKLDPDQQAELDRLMKLRQSVVRYMAIRLEDN